MTKKTINAIADSEIKKGMQINHLAKTRRRFQNAFSMIFEKKQSRKGAKKKKCDCSDRTQQYGNAAQ